MKKTVKERVAALPSIEEIIGEHEKDPEFKKLLDRARLKLEIAHAVKQAREKAGMSQGQLAEAIGSPASMIGRLEGAKDQRVPGLELLAKIARATRKRLIIHQSDIHFELTIKLK